MAGERAAELPFVIGCGFGRTGTASLRTALQTLTGKPVYHMKAVMAGGPQHSEAWLRAAETRAAGGPADMTLVEELLVGGGYGGAVDWPAAAFWRELLAARPGAVLVVSERSNLDSWWESVWESIFLPQRTWWMRPARVLVPGPAVHDRMVRKVIWDGTFGGRFADKEHAKRVHADHIAAVLAAVPREKVLVHRSSDGWAPLCEFLRVPIPESPYPRTNERGATARMLRAGSRRDALRLAAIAVASVAGVVAACRVLRASRLK